MNRQFGFPVKFGLVLLAILLGSFAVKTLALQDEEEDDQRKIWNKQIADARKKAGATSAPPPGRRPARAAGDDLVGVTLWSLKPAPKPASAREEEDKPRLLVQKDGNKTPMTPQRVAAGTEFDKDAPVRLSIEVPREGASYLYVIDREMYQGGKFSAPYLVFPTRAARGGDNLVEGGKVFDVPSASDTQPYFTIAGTLNAHPGYIGEQLTIIVSPEKLNIPPIGEGPVELKKEDVEKWERMWGGEVELRGAPKSAGKEWTKEEKTAAESKGERLLTQGPLPQTIYRVSAKSEGKLLFKVTLPVKK